VACSFGEVDGGETASAPMVLPEGSVTEVPDITEGDSNVVDPSGGNVAVSNPNAEASAEKPYDPDADPFSTEMGQQVEAILRTNCGTCHIGAGAQGEFGYLLNMEQLVTSGKVVPGNKEDSQLYVRMVGGSMPPAAQRVVRTPTYSEIDLVGEFIDQLELPDPGSDCESEAFMDVDTQIRLMQSDMAGLDDIDKSFTRYLTITYSSNAGECGRALQRQRNALFKGINSVSTNPTVSQPQAIDAAETIYRIDIRDYNWDRLIDLQDNDVSDPANVDFNDGWEAIIANPQTAAYAVEYEGEAADDLEADAATLVPFMPVNAFIQATEFGDLYYTLINGRASLFDFEREVLLIDTALEIEDNQLMRAGFSNSGVSKQERVLNRFDSGLAAGQSYWISFDFDGGNGGDGANGFERDVANDSIYASPLEFAFGGGEAIFSLPNGMQGYYAADGAGNRLATAPIGVVIDPAQNNGLVTNGASCHSCHNAGMITFTDTVRQFVEDNRVRFDNETFENVMEQYPDGPTFQAQMDRDSEVHIAATERAGVPAGAPDAVSRVYLDFQLGNVDLTIAAGELGVDREFLLRNIDLLDPRLANLGVDGGYIDRNIMDDTFLDSICILQSVQENTPVGCQ
jgi:mono/diheme cytochrome c family protein